MIFHIFAIRELLFTIKRVLHQKTSCKAQNVFKTQVVVDPVALASNFSPFGIKHQSRETKWPNLIALAKMQMKVKRNGKSWGFNTKDLDTVYLAFCKPFTLL
jgi:hypothetical protein